MALKATKNTLLKATGNTLLKAAKNTRPKAARKGPVRAAVMALMATAALAACNTRTTDPAFGIARGLVQGVLSRDTAPAPPAIDPRQVLTRTAINTIAVPLILVEIPSTQAVATLQRVAVNGRNETWQIGEDTTVTLTQNGLLRQTRGLVHDLYATDISATEAALRARAPGPYQRVYVHTNGDLDSVRTPVTCDLRYGPLSPLTIFGETRSLTPVTEVCTFAPTGDAFTNRYWIDQTGVIWTSHQWTSPNLGHLHIQRLHR